MISGSNSLPESMAKARGGKWYPRVFVFLYIGILSPANFNDFSVSLEITIPQLLVKLSAGGLRSLALKSTRILLRQLPLKFQFQFFYLFSAWAQLTFLKIQLWLLNLKFMRNLLLCSLQSFTCFHQSLIFPFQVCTFCFSIFNLTDYWQENSFVVCVLTKYYV